MIWTTFWQDETFVKSNTKQLAKEKVINRLLKWNKEMAEVAWLCSVEKLAEAGIYDRPPAKTWHSKRTVLIGDAAHPMTPSL
jgi:salicylate hydroxylase